MQNNLRNCTGSFRSSKVFAFWRVLDGFSSLTLAFSEDNSTLTSSSDEAAPVERASHLIYAIYCYVSVTGGIKIFDEAVPAYISRNIHGSSAADWLQQITGKRKLNNMYRSQPKRNPPAFDNIIYFLFGSVPRLNIALHSNLFDCNVSNMDLRTIYFEPKSRQKNHDFPV